MDPRVCTLLAAFWMLGGVVRLELAAQREFVVARLYTLKDALPESAVNCTFRDSRGFLQTRHAWFGISSLITRLLL